MAGDLDFTGLVPEDLPDGRSIVQAGIEHGRRIDRAPSLFCETNGVRSEREYRERCRAEGQATTSINVGLNTWADTREALGCIIDDSRSRGVRPPDQFTLLAERRMGLPEDMRASAAQETGPCLWTEQDWWELTHSFSIQPGAEDNMIGGPGSLENVTRALQVGVTTVGVLSQYFWRWPYWDDDVAQTVAVVKAAGALAAWADDGACFNSYIDDGYPGVFHDYANLVGWTMVERYVSEVLIGAPYSASWGGLTSDPILKTAVTLALHETNPNKVPPAFTHGDTIGNDADLEANYGTMSTDVLFMKVTDMRYRIGGAVKAVPVTEAIRVPSWQEISAVHAVNRRLENYVDAVEGVIDWNSIITKRDLLVEGGTRFFNALLSGMKRGGIDTEDPLEFLFALKKLGAVQAEEFFGAGAPDSFFPRGRRPVFQTDLLRRTLAERDAVVDRLAATERTSVLAGLRIVVASTDVHELAVLLLCSALGAAGADVTDLGISRDPEDIAKAAVETAAHAVAVTTHNGVARTFATRLISELAERGMSSTLVSMGGVLNEDEEGSDIPVNVTGVLAEMGVLVPAGIDELIDELAHGTGASLSRLATS
jgi:methylmalonyl-CoA mutase cobalamin-binding domain/chain